MFFHSITSLFIFLPFIFFSYPIIKRLIKNFQLLFTYFFSYILFFDKSRWFVIPLLISAISDYLISKELIQNRISKEFSRILLLVLSLLINIGLLIISYKDLIPDIFQIENLTIKKHNKYYYLQV